MPHATKKYELSEGVTIEDIDSPVMKAFEREQKAFPCGFGRFQPYNVVFPKCYGYVEKTLKNFEVYPDDVWISSFPKCGTTWTQEMVWCIKNDLDFKRAKQTKLDFRVPYVE